VPGLGEYDATVEAVSGEFSVEATFVLHNHGTKGSDLEIHVP
jgi:hypothetical protein